MEYDVDPEGFQGFWDWIIERQNIYVKKEIEGKNPPWTDSEVLQNRHFCNVYRQLDKQTAYYIKNIANEGSPEDVFLSTALFRIINKGETWDYIGLLDSDNLDAKGIVEEVNKARDSGLTAFNSAYMVTGAAYSEYSDKMEKYTIGMCRDEILPNIDTYWWDHFYKTEGGLVPITSPEELTDLWTEIPGVSDFIAYEWYCDLTHNDWFPYDKNDYVNLGPGANRGINWIFDTVPNDVPNDVESSWLKKHLDRSCPVDAVEFIEWCVEIQDEYLPDDFHKPDGQDLTLREIEHSLCEYDKYRRVKFGEEHGIQQRMKKYDYSKHEPDDQSGFGAF